jgi:hypothetical protein
LARCVKAAVTVELVAPEWTKEEALLMWGRRMEMSAGGKFIGSEAEGDGCVVRYCRSLDSSSLAKPSAIQLRSMEGM